MPAGVDLAGAGAAPLAGITALIAIDALELSAGDTLLVVGATGGVGSLAVQLAARAGATVIAPALPEDEGYLRELGVVPPGKSSIRPEIDDVRVFVEDVHLEIARLEKSGLVHGWMGTDSPAGYAATRTRSL